MSLILGIVWHLRGGRHPFAECLAVITYILGKTYWLYHIWFFLDAQPAGVPANGSEIKAFHGTSVDSVDSIMKHGFRPSRIGMLGQGVYVSRDFRKARNYGGDRGVILEVRVKVGTICKVDRQGHRWQHGWHDDFDTCWVPSGCGMVTSNLEEGCVADPRNVSLVRVLRRPPAQFGTYNKVISDAFGLIRCGTFTSKGFCAVRYLQQCMSDAFCPTLYV